jgi:AcrR family transcriptional regulator
MGTNTASAPRSSGETKARILLAAQDIFASKGYSHAGLREIASASGVAPSLLIKYFGTKARLFEESLIAAILPLRHFQQDRARVGEAIVASVLDRESRMLAPGMIALASGDAEAREIAQRVVKEEIVVPMSRWLGREHAAARALDILAMTTGFWMFHRNMSTLLEADEMARSAALFARSLQDLVDSD